MIIVIVSQFPERHFNCKPFFLASLVEIGLVTEGTDAYGKHSLNVVAQRRPPDISPVNTVSSPDVAGHQRVMQELMQIVNAIFL
jgi:hypothetical protein